MHRAWLGVGLVIVVSCGSRSALLGGGAVDGGGAAGVSGGVGGTVATGGVGASAEAGVDATVDALPPPPPPCALVAAGPALNIVQFTDRHATAPSAVTLGASDVAVQTLASGGNSSLHSDIRLVRFSMGASWPGSFVQTQAPLLFGIESHGWANLVVAPSGKELALSWHGDQGGNSRPQFRLWDIASWSPNPPVDIMSQGEAVIDMAAGAGVGEMSIGYGGSGYGVVWREVTAGGGSPTRPVAAVLDAEGQRVLGPHPVAGFSPYPGRSPRIVWTGAAYLMATSFVSCTAGDALCAPLAVVISRIRPASGDAWDDSGIDFAAVIPAQPGSTVVGSTALSHHVGRTYVAWSEGNDADAAAPRRIRAAELSPAGEVVAGPVLVDAGAPMQSRLTLLASDLGVTVTWAEDSDAAVPDNTIGRSHIVSTHLDLELKEITARVTVPATRWDSYGPPRATALASPRSLLIVWSGRREVGDGYDDTFAARLDCAP